MALMHHWPSRATRLALLATRALAVAACSTSAAGPGTPSGLPDGIPVPADAAVVVGQGGGYDAGATLYGFSSDLAPAAALHGYGTQLAAAGYARAGTSGRWQLYRHGTTLVAIRTGESGPPTDLLVRVTTNPATPAPAGGGTQAGSPGSASSGISNGHGGGGSAATGTSGANGNPAGNAGGNPAPGANGNANGNPAGNAGGNPAPGANSNGVPAATPGPNGAAAATTAPNGNALGTGGGNPAPAANGAANGNAAGNAGGNSNGSANGHPKTPIPQPPPAHGQPVAPPGQAVATPGS